jgi:hypothetical protein
VNPAGWLLFQIVEPPVPTILLALLAVTLMLVGWLRDRHVRQRNAGSPDR